MIEEFPTSISLGYDMNIVCILIKVDETHNIPMVTH